MRTTKVAEEWWLPQETGGFFGEFYLLGDNSLEGPDPLIPRSIKERTNREVRYIIDALDLRAGQRVLDCPCGSGRHLVRLAEEGIRMTGVDLNPGFLKIAAEKVAQQKIDSIRARLVLGDMRELPIDAGSFDAVINMFTSFGFFSGHKDNLKVLQGFRRSLKTGGKLLIHFDYNPLRIKKGLSWRDRTTRSLKDNAKLKVVERFDPRTKRMNGHWTIVSDPPSKTQTRTYTLRVYCRERLAEMLFECGFREPKFFGSLDAPGQALTINSRETVVIAQTA